MSLELRGKAESKLTNPKREGLVKSYPNLISGAPLLIYILLYRIRLARNNKI
jgi:hypothetical protein